MGYGSEKIKYGREHIYVFEIDLDFCSLTFGVGNCKAGLRQIVTNAVSVDDFNIGDEIQGDTSGAIGDIEAITGSSPNYTISYRLTNQIDFNSAGETITNNTATGAATLTAAVTTLINDNDNCYNTITTTQDIDAYTSSTKTYRFCSQRSPHPIALDAIPSIDRVNMTPTEISLAGGLSSRSNLAITLIDHAHGDNQFTIDKYLANRTYIASENGTFWTKLRARNPNYQFKECRLLSGYLVDGVYDASNFETRYYVIDRLDVSNGRASLTAKDPLSLAMKGKALAPTPSTGELIAGITAGAGTATLTPAGIGNSEYSAAGKVTINSEVISFTRVADVLTLTTRGQNNTVAAAHALGDTVQEALEYSAVQVNTIVNDLLTNYSGVNSSFIPTATWQSDVDTYLSGLLTGIIVKPTDVNKLLMELTENMPHYLWWHDKDQEIQFTPLQEPPPSANILDMSSELIAGQTTVKDRPDLRRSTIYIHYGQIDPTKQLTETNNYAVSYVRVDTASIAKFENNQDKVIFSRWLTSVNLGGASQVATLIGRRFANTPREITFSLDPKDSDVWAGQNRMINHRDIVDFTGSPVNTLFQILSSKEDGHFKYKALEFNYGAFITGDTTTGVDLIPLNVDDEDINLRTIYDSLFPAPDATTVAKFIIKTGTTIGSTTTGAGLDTGSWPAGAVITLQLDTGAFVVGKGGEGSGSISGAATVGGLAIDLSYALTLINNGVIGGGGGGGGWDEAIGTIGSTSFTSRAGGGGGAGSVAGIKGINTEIITAGVGMTIIQAEDGLTATGGAGGVADTLRGGPRADGGAGGDLAATGTAGNQTAGAAGGDAIDKNGFVLTQTVTGTIHGAIIP